MYTQALLNGCGRAIAATQPDDFGRMAEEETPLMKVGVFGDEHEHFLGGVVPDGFVGGLAQPHVSHMLGAGIFLSKRVGAPTVAGLTPNSSAAGSTVTATLRSHM